MMKNANRVKAEHRNLLALVLALDPEARKQYVHLMRMKVENIRPDYMFFRNANGTYDRVPDPGAWNAYLPIANFGSISVCLIRREGYWSIHS